MESINGIGTTLYGKKNFNPTDGSYVATEWFIFFFLPIFPIGTYRVVNGKTEVGIPSGKLLPGSSTEYYMVKIKLDWRQVIKTYLVIWGIGILLFVILFFISGINH
jgi:hypothetical protein